MTLYAHRSAPDLAQAHNFLDVLTDGYPVTFQTFDDRASRGELARILHGDLDQHASTLTSLNQQGAGIFVMINEGDGKGRQAANVTGVRALFVDLDGAPVDPVIYATLPPHLIVATSSGRYHAYWRVTGIELAAFKPAQQALARLFGGDPAVCDLARVMRLPGFYHCKKEPTMTYLIESDPAQPYSYATMSSAFPSIETTINQPKVRRTYGLPRALSGPGALAMALRITTAAQRRAEQVRQQGQGRHAFLLWAGWAARNNGLSHADALILLRDLATLLPPREHGPVSDAEIAGVLAWVYGRPDSGEPWPTRPLSYRARVQARMRGWR